MSCGVVRLRGIYERSGGASAKGRSRLRVGMTPGDVRSKSTTSTGGGAATQLAERCGTDGLTLAGQQACAAVACAALCGAGRLRAPNRKPEHERQDDAQESHCATTW